MEARYGQNLRKHTGEKPFTRDQCDFKKKKKKTPKHQVLN